MSEQSRKLQYKKIRDDATTHVGTAGDIWYDPATTVLRFYNGEPGGATAGATSAYKDYGQGATNLDVAIDLTYTNQWLVDLGAGNHYTLADGVDGQELAFFAAAGLDSAGVERSDILVNSVKYWNDAGPSSSWTSGARYIRLFDHNNEPLTNAVAKVTATWFNGSWHFDGGKDMGGV